MRWTAIVAVALLWSCDPQADAQYLGEPLLTLRGVVVNQGPLPALEAAMLWQRGPPPSMNDQDLATRATVDPGFPANFSAHLYHPPPAAARRSLALGEPIWARATAAAVPKGSSSEQIAAAGAGAFPAPAGVGSDAGAAPGSPDGGSDGGASPGGPDGGSDAGPAAGNPDGGASGGSDAGTPVVPPVTPYGYGVDAHHWVMYLASDVKSGSVTEWWLGAPLRAGFHLLRVAPAKPQCLTAAQIDACVAELRARGLDDDVTARNLCLAPYQLTVAPPEEELVLTMGTAALEPPAGSCP